MAVKKSTKCKKGSAKSGASRRPKKKSFKKEMLERLLEEKKKLLSEVSQKVRTESDASKFEIGDIYDIASSERERELTLMLGDREREKLHEIDMALERLQDKDYGICEECGEPIGEARLRALPFTRVCVDCKTRAEKESLYKGRLEEVPVGVIEKPDTEEDEF